MTEHSRIWVAAVAAAVLASASCTHETTEPCPPSSVGFGQRQLDQMLDDRPDMQEAIPPSHPVRQWLADGFDGKRAGLRVHWCGNLSGGGRAAEYVKPVAHYPAIICVSAGTEITAIDRWAAVVYAMHNHENDWDAVGSEASRGLLDADSFAEKCTQLEFTALQRTQQLLLRQPLPPSSHGRDKWYNWVTTGLGTYDEYKSASDCPRGMSFRERFHSYRMLFGENWQ